MIEKTVTAYICEHCGKKQFAKGTMRRHEKHCTANPGRECRLCGCVEIAGLAPTDFGGLDKLVEILRDEDVLPKERMEKVREETDCPACILAAIRQSGVWKSYIEEPCDMEVGEDHSMWHSWNWLPPYSEHTNADAFLGFEYKAEKERILKLSREVEVQQNRDLTAYWGSL